MIHSSSLHKAHSRHSFNRFLFESEISNGPPFGKLTNFRCCFLLISSSSYLGDKSRSFLFRLCQFFVLLFRLVTPFSYLYLAIAACHFFFPIVDSNNFLLKLLPNKSVLSWSIFAWMTVEALFFPYYYYLFTRLNDFNEDLDHMAENKEARFKLVKNCFQANKMTSNRIYVY
jgi:hypothetical protein